MPGQKISQHQIGLYMKIKKEGKSQIVAAAKAGFSERSARNIQKRGFQCAHADRTWRTRSNPFEGVWEKDLVPMLEKHPNLQARTLLDRLQELYEGQYPDKLLRTLQRRTSEWKALYGPEKEVIFRQNHPPGFQGLSDFTNGRSLSVTIRGEPLDHLLYHYRLACSGWTYVAVVLGGESFTACAENLQNALWDCGGCPETHRTDSLSAAFKNLSKEAKKDLTKSYEDVCYHYGMEPTRNNRGKSHENGSIEAANRHFKSRISQSLMVRDSRDFSSLEEYRQFIRKIVENYNRRIEKEYVEELAHLKPLPEVKTIDYTEERVRVTRSGTIYIKGVSYSVPSRLVGSTVKIHLYDDRLECFSGGSYIQTLSRKRKGKNVRSIDYRHLIGNLVRKPGAFINYVFKNEFFPTFAFRQTWEELTCRHDTRKACREYVSILKEAAQDDREEKVSYFLERALNRGTVASASEVKALFRPSRESMPKVNSPSGSLKDYQTLLQGGAV